VKEYEPPYSPYAAPDHLRSNLVDAAKWLREHIKQIQNHVQNLEAIPYPTLTPHIFLTPTFHQIMSQRQLLPLFRDPDLDTVIEFCQHAEVHHLRKEGILYTQGDVSL